MVDVSFVHLILEEPHLNVTINHGCYLICRCVNRNEVEIQELL